MAEENYMNKGAAGSPQVQGDGPQTTRQQGDSGSSGSGGNVQSRTSKRAKSMRRAAGEGAQIWDDATAGIRTLKENTDEYVRQNPTKAVLTALAIGFVLSLMRRH